MLVKVNGIISKKGQRLGRQKKEKDDEKKVERRVKVTLLDIDDLGSVIPVKELELRLPQNDESIAKTLASSRYAAVFTEEEIDNDKKGGNVIIVANGITEEELNNEKKKMIDKAHKARS